MELRFWADTDTGRSREHNEDNYLVDRRLQLFVVCDGIGGHAAGDVASATAVRAIQESLAESLTVMTRDRLATGGEERRQRLMDHLADAVRLANERVYRHATSPEVQRQMGTTCSMLLVAGDDGFIAHVGDSRIYRIRDESAEQLTDDHSLRQEMIRRGQLKEGESFDQSDAITRAVGVEDQVEVDTFRIGIEPGDRFVLCSDGLSEYVAEASSVATLASAPDLRQVVDTCIEHANEGGGKDNVTAIAVGARDGNGMYDALQLDARLHALARTRPFDNLEGRELRTIFEAGRVHQLEPGEAILKPEDSASRLFVVLDGELKESEPEMSRQHFEPGDAVGARWCFTDSGPTRRIEAVDNGARLFSLSKKDLISIIADNRSTGLKILWNTSRAFADDLQREIPGVARAENPRNHETRGDGDDESVETPVSGESRVGTAPETPSEDESITETVKINLENDESER